MARLLTQSSALALVLGLSGCTGAQGVAGEPARAAAPLAAALPSKPSEPLALALQHLRLSRYQQAEAAFRKLLKGSSATSAELGLSELLLLTGRYEEAIERLRAARARGALPPASLLIEGEALRRLGRVEEARDVLVAGPEGPEGRAVRLLLGEVLLELGRPAEAAEALLTLIEDYNGERIAVDDGASLALVGRAAHLLGSPKDANDAFNEAERAAPGNVRALLWRAELFLERYDPGQAEEVVAEVLKAAPHHPEALVLMAQVRLDQALDFAEAERLVQRALEVDPKLARAYFVLAGVALRDLEIEQAESAISAGLAHNPRDLELLSLLATARYLADDELGFERAKQKVLSQNPTYSRFFNIVGEYADWEHRYDELVTMMREAVLLDPENAKARAQLGLNLIRSGNEPAGLASLRHAFAQDPFNVRVFNTLNLYEQSIARDYVTVSHGPFSIRYHKEERAILERYVPALLDRGFGRMVDYYGFRPETPLGIELYPDRKSFSIRTSGLPNTAIQGVCFGRTLAAISVREERSNLGMTLWHELSHVFHIQLSRSRVPRWFTEGLAEYETLVERPEWAREHDALLYRAWRGGRLPKVASMSRAFTRAEALSDVAAAYYASSQIMEMLAERHGRPKLRQMLELWGQGKRTQDVLPTALGQSSEEVDAEFQTYLGQRLERFTKQFVSMDARGGLPALAEAAAKRPKDARTQTAYALALFDSGRVERARATVDAALRLDARLPDARFLRARIHLHKKEAGQALGLLDALVRDRHDGYEVQMLRARALDRKAAEQAYARAHALDRTQSEPIAALVAAARARKDPQGELEGLKKLARLEEHNASVFRALLRGLLAAGRATEALDFVDAAVYADLSGLETHRLVADVLEQNGNLERAAYELESATLCDGRPQQKAEAHRKLAMVYLSLNDRTRAKHHAELARSLDPTDGGLEALGL